GLRPPSVSKTAALMNKLFPFFGLTSLTDEQKMKKETTSMIYQIRKDADKPQHILTNCNG
ncbi:MAG: hypothetical protein LUH13_00215, partial [Oscillospiraceae bacterium]|nr:hypothetical protein [Oscillospiraceae bacterium]